MDNPATQTYPAIAAAATRPQSAHSIIALLQAPQNAHLLAHEELAPAIAAGLAKIHSGETHHLPAHTAHALARRMRGIDLEIRQLAASGRTGETGLLQQKYALFSTIETACRQTRLVAPPAQAYRQR